MQNNINRKYVEAPREFTELESEYDNLKNREHESSKANQRSSA